jgi:hypothetical protein
MHASRTRPIVSRASATFRAVQKPSGRLGQAVDDFAAGIAGRHHRLPPFAFGKAARHRASRPHALEEYPFPLVQCNIPESTRKLPPRQFCSSLPPRCSFASPNLCSAIGGLGAIASYLPIDFSGRSTGAVRRNTVNRRGARQPLTRSSRVEFRAARKATRCGGNQQLINDFQRWDMSGDVA